MATSEKNERIEVICVTSVLVIVSSLLLLLAFKGCEYTHQEDMKHIERGDQRAGQSWIPAK